METTPTSILVNALSAGLQEGTSSPGDVAAVAATGELLRRTLAMQENPSDEAIAVLNEYDRYLRANAALIPAELDPDLDNLIGELETYSQLGVTERDSEDGIEALRGIDEVLSIGAAACRATALAESKLTDLGLSAASRLREAAPRLPELWQHAEDREQDVGPDPDFMDLYGFWEVLACLAPSRVALELGLSARPAEERERMIQRALKVLLKEEPRRLWDRIHEGIKRLIERAETAIEVRLPPRILAFDHNDGAALPKELTVLQDFDGALTILQSEDRLIVSVPEDHELEVSQISVSYGPSPEAEQLSPNSIQLCWDAPTAETTILRLILRVDGDELEIPPLQVRWDGSKEPTE